MYRLVAAVFVVVALATGCSAETSGSSGSGEEIEITMRDSRFDPAKVTVKRGETVRFRFVNRGSLEHEAFIGNADEQERHEAAMSDTDEGSEHGGHGGSDDAVTVKPGKSATLEHRFTEPGTTLIGCHEPGHWDQGMKVKVTVE